MKLSILAAAAVMALFTACSSVEDLPVTKDSDTDISGSTVSEDIISDTQSSEAEIIPVSETAVSYAQAESTEAPEADKKAVTAEYDFSSISTSIDLAEFADEGSYPSRSVLPCGGNNICAVYNYTDGSGGYVKIIDIVNKTAINRIESPRSGCYAYISENKCGGNVKAYAEFCSVYDGENEVYKALTEIYEDGSFMLTTGLSAEDIRYPCGDRLIVHRDGGLSLADEETPFIERYSEKREAALDFNARSYVYSLPLDNDRFIYRAIGYSTMPMFGIYDFSDGSSLAFSDSDDKLPIASADGLIYSAERTWNGCDGSSVFVSDPATLETKLLSSSPFELSEKEYVDYFMPSDYAYIGAVRKKSDNSGISEFALLDKECGSVITRYSLGSTSGSCDSAFFTDEYICFCYADNYDITVKTAPRPDNAIFIEETADRAELVYLSGNTVHKINSTDMEESDDHSITAFDNVLGYSGSAISCSYFGGTFTQKYYLAIENGSPVCIAESFGGDENSDTAADIDGNGVNELICNCVFGGDGAMRTYIFKADNGIIKRADCMDLIDPDNIFSLASANSTWTEYLPDEGVIECGYISADDQNFVRQKLDIDMNRLVFTEFTSSFISDTE